MARIETYVPDNQVTENDIVIGSDGDNFNRTKNFKVSALTQFVGNQATNNIPKIINVKVPNGSSIEQELDNISITVTQNDSPVIINFFVIEDTDVFTVSGSATVSAFVVSKYTFLFPLGNGVYNPVSASVGLDNLLLLEKTPANANDIDDFDDSVILSLGDVTGSDFITEINEKVPSFDLSDSSKTYYFTYEKDNTLFFVQFIGANGLYGLNDLSADEDDFVSLDDSILDNDNVKAKYVNIDLDAETFETEQQEVDSVVRVINNLNSSVTIDEKELFVVYSDSLQNDNGTNYRSVYIVNTGKGVYGSGQSQITSANVLKIRGEQIDELLSSYQNDANFATESYVDSQAADLVDVSGDTMTGDLNMGGNQVTNLSSPINSGDAVNLQYVDDLVNFKGVFTSESSIVGLAGINGDYAILSDGKVYQLWTYSNTSWNLMNAKPYSREVSTNISLSNNFHNSTLNFTSTGLTVTLLNNLVEGFTFFGRNFSGSTLELATSGTDTISQTEIENGNLFTCTLDGGNFVVDTTNVNDFEEVKYGIYDYNDNQSAQTLTADTYQELSNNGAGVNTYKNPISGIPEIYNISTDRFDFSDLNLNDFVNIRIDLDVTTASNGEDIDCELVLGEGQAGEYKIPFFSSKYFKSAATYKIAEDVEIYMGNTLTKDNPAYIQIRSSGADDVNLNGFFVKVTNRN